MDKTLWRAYLVELVGTFALVYFGAGVVFGAVAGALAGWAAMSGTGCRTLTVGLRSQEHGTIPKLAKSTVNDANRVMPDEGSIGSVLWSPDGRWLAYVYNGAVYRLPYRTDRHVKAPS